LTGLITEKLTDKIQMGSKLLRWLLVCSVLTIFPLGLQVISGLDGGLNVAPSLVGMAFAYGDEVNAESDKADKRKYQNTKTRKRQSVGQKCATKLEAVQNVLGGVGEGGDGEPNNQQLSGLIAQLKGFMTKSCSSSYEKSQVYNLLGFVYYSLDNYPKATASYRAMAAEPDVDERQKIDTYYTLAQLYLMLEDYRSAAQQLEAWMAASAIVSPDGKVLLAQAYYQLDRKVEALKLVSSAVESVEAKGGIPKEHWWSLQKALYFEKTSSQGKAKGSSGKTKKAQNKNKDYQKVVSILKKLITYYPSHSYWHQLGGMYGQMEEDGHRLASLDILYLDKALTKSQDLMSLAYLYLGAGVPYRAAQIIEEGMKQGVIERSGKNMETLGGAWQQARETKKALVTLEEAAKLSDKGAIWSRLGMAYLDLDENTKAIQAARNALKKGNLKKPSYTQMTLGNALVNLHCYEDAVEVFRDAAKGQKGRVTAEKWVEYVSGEATRRDRLIESGANISGCQLP
jgi:tetratricopeptide (TPR) repeat protein